MHLKKFYFTKKEKFIKKTILFSPSAASFDNFKNFEDRGFYFNKLVKKISECLINFHYIIYIINGGKMLIN